MVDDRHPRQERFDWEAARDLTASSGEELREELSRLCAEEEALAYRLEVLRGRIPLVRAELAGRGLATVSSEELARVLLGERGRGSS